MCTGCTDTLKHLIQGPGASLGVGAYEGKGQETRRADSEPARGEGKTVSSLLLAVAGS